MEQIHPDEMVPDTKYRIKDPSAASLAKLTRLDEMDQTLKIYKTVTFKRVAYRLNGVWHYLFHVEGKRRYFTENDIFYK